MSAKGVLVRKEIVTVLRKARKPMTAGEIGRKIGQRRNNISEAIQRIIAKNPKVITKFKDRNGFVSFTLYLENTKVLEQKISCVESILPQEPWRGWENPVTGYKPARLGL